MKIESFNVYYDSGEVKKYEEGYLLVPYEAARDEIKVMTISTYETYCKLYQISKNIKKISRKIKWYLKYSKKKLSVECKIKYIEVIDKLGEKKTYDKFAFITGIFDEEEVLKGIWFIRVNMQENELKEVCKKIDEEVKIFFIKLKLIKKKLRKQKKC